MEQATAGVQSLRCHKSRWAGLAKRKVVLPRKVAGEDEVLDAENANGELPLEKWLATIIAEECTDEYIDDPHAKTCK